MKTDDIIKPSHDSSSSDSASSAGAAAPILDNIGLRDEIGLDEETSILEPLKRDGFSAPSMDDVESMTSPPVPVDAATKPALGSCGLDIGAVCNASADGAVMGTAPLDRAPAVKRAANPHKKPKLRNLNAEQAYELLSSARTADHVELFLRDGRTYEGAILFNDMKGTGRLINVTKEISVDFRAEQVRDVRF